MPALSEEYILCCVNLPVVPSRDGHKQRASPQGQCQAVSRAGRDDHRGVPWKRNSRVVWNFYRNYRRCTRRGRPRLLKTLMPPIEETRPALEYRRCGRRRCESRRVSPQSFSIAACASSPGWDRVRCLAHPLDGRPSSVRRKSIWHPGREADWSTTIWSKFSKASSL